MSGRSVYAAANASENKEAALTAVFEGTVREEASEGTCTTVTGNLKIYFSYLDEVGETMQARRLRMGDYIFDGEVKMELPLTHCDGVGIAGGRPHNPLNLRGLDIHRILMEITGEMERQARLPNPGRRPNPETTTTAASLVNKLKF